MKVSFFKIIAILIIVILVFTKCAQVGSLNGGLRDAMPPKLMEAMPRIKSVNFNYDEIILRFNEFVQLKDLATQLLITPKLKTEPEIIADGKKIKIKLNSKDLLPNTTYRFYFGNAIADMHEGNMLTNFDYVFSTGNFIDTLKIKGIIIEEFNTKPVADMVVGLYDSKEIKDSLGYTTIPNYACRTNANGEFMFENLPKSEFKIIAFTDKNKNYLYDGETEKIAFRDTNLVLINDTIIKLKAFQEIASKVFIKKINSPYYGYSNIILNKRVKISISLFNKLEGENLYFPLNSSQRDTIAIYYKSLNDTLKLLSTNLESKKMDTLIISLPKQNKVFKKYPNLKTNLFGDRLALNNNLQLTFLSLMDTVKTDLSKIKITSKDDSLISTLPVKALWISPYSIQLQTIFKPATAYTLKIDTAAFYSENKLYNDSIKQNFKTDNKLDFGKLTLKLLFNKKQSYVVQLINDKNEVIRDSFLTLSLAGTNAKTIEFTDVLPAAYQVKIIIDTNEDKKWNTGNYLQNKQPEQVILHSKTIKVIADWEVEEEILIKE